MLPGAMSEEAVQIERLQKELRTVAALEVRRRTPYGHSFITRVSAFGELADARLSDPALS